MCYSRSYISDKENATLGSMALQTCSTLGNWTSNRSTTWTLSLQTCLLKKFWVAWGVKSTRLPIEHIIQFLPGPTMWLSNHGKPRLLLSSTRQNIVPWISHLNTWLQRNARHWKPLPRPLLWRSLCLMPKNVLSLPRSSRMYVLLLLATYLPLILCR